MAILKFEGVSSGVLVKLEEVTASKENRFTNVGKEWRSFSIKRVSGKPNGGTGDSAEDMRYSVVVEMNNSDHLKDGAERRRLLRDQIFTCLGY